MATVIRPVPANVTFLIAVSLSHAVVPTPIVKPIYHLMFMSSPCHPPPRDPGHLSVDLLPPRGTMLSLSFSSRLNPPPPFASHQQAITLGPSSPFSRLWRWLGSWRPDCLSC